MKLKNILKYLAVIFIITLQLRAQNTNPEVTNVAFSITDTTVTVTYNVYDAEQSTVTITMQVSSDNGSTWDYNYFPASGDIGTGVAIGVNKVITWDYTGQSSKSFQIMILANDNTAGGSVCPGIPTVEHGGKTYNTILIGTQCWLQENLDIGTMINGSQNPSNDGVIQKYCHNDDPNNCTTFGGLYQWDEAKQYDTTQGAQGICPNGWHIPTFAEFQTLKAAVASDDNALKAVGQGSGTGAGTNTSGFSALFAGYRDKDGIFGNLSDYALFWSSMQYNTAYAYFMGMTTLYSNVYIIDFFKEFGLSIRCLKDTVGVPPEAPTLLNPSNGATNANPPPTLSWNASSGATSYRLQVSTSDQFTTTVYDQSNITITSQEVTGLSNATTYYWRVNAANSYGTSNWSDVWSFYTEPVHCPGIVTVDYEGKTYNTVQIGTQCWLRENLDIGTRINGIQNQDNNGILEKYCYDDLESNCNTYGGLYQWNEAMQYDTTQGAQGICPNGWHIPTNAEFQALSSAVGGNGNALKAIGQGTGSGAGTNTSGFCALIAGLRFNSGDFFYSLGEFTYFWSSMEYVTTHASGMHLNSRDRNISYGSEKVFGFSVRCVKDTGGIQLEAPTLLNPSNGATNVNPPPTLSWNASNGATSYRLQVSTSDQFTTTIYDSSNIVNTSQVVSGLSHLITYYWRVNAVNSYGTSAWSSVWSFYTEPVRCPGIPTVEYGGKTYNTVQIGTQCWLRENLDIGTLLEWNQNPSNNGYVEKYCQNGDCNKYGGLYEWDEMMQYTTTESTQGICPNGWRIPTIAELNTLGGVAGNSNALKAIGQGVGDGAGTNESGFSGIMGGLHVDQYYLYLGENGYFWSSTEYEATNSYYLNLWAYGPSINNGSDSKGMGFSVRCLKDPGGVPLEAPTLINPSFGATNVNPLPTLSWNASSGATSYRLQVSTSDQFTTTVYDQSNITTTSQEVTGLSNSTPYYWRVNAANSYGTSNWSDVWSFYTEPVHCPGIATVDYGGKTYNTVQIGTQCWLRENLDVGTRINGSQNASNDGVIEKYCYNNEPNNCTTYGGLYQWNETMQYITTPGTQGICPSGWHIPTYNEFQTSFSAVGGNGSALKAIGQGIGGGAGTNTSGFSALLAGYGNGYGDFINLGAYACFWSSTEFSALTADWMLLMSDNSGIYFNPGNKMAGFSVRCLEN